MSNTITGLIPTIYEALDVVSRELVGMIPAVSTDSGLERAALNQVVRAAVAPPAVAQDLAPGVTAPNDGDQTFTYYDLTMTKARGVGIRWAGEEGKSLNNGGHGRNRLMKDQFENAFRTLCNEVESDLCGEHVNFSRAYGTAGTTPFATDLSDTAQVRKILDDNGAPLGDRHGVINTTAGAKMRTLGQLTKANEAGGAEFLRQGTLLDIHGISLRESAQIKTNVKGTNNGAATTNAAGYAVGATVITIASAGTGSIVAGDVITFAGDVNKYVVASGDADVSNGGTITLAKPGLMQAIPASAVVITTINNAVRNMFFRRTALVLATRAPALPEEGDMADDRMMVTDPHSGLSFEISLYKQYRQVRYEVALAWGWKTIKPEHTALLLG